MSTRAPAAVSAALELEPVPCPLCGGGDVALRVPETVPPKLALELVMPINRPLGLGEVVRYFIRRA